MALISGICKSPDGEPCMDCFEMGEMDCSEIIPEPAVESPAQAYRPLSSLIFAKMPH